MAQAPLSVPPPHVNDSLSNRRIATRGTHVKSVVEAVEPVGLVACSLAWTRMARSGQVNTGILAG